MLNARYIFRMDDICPTMNWDKFNALMKIFDSKGLVPLLGVIPENKDPFLIRERPDPKFWDIINNLLQKKKIEVAQHGTYHEYISSEKGILATDFDFPARSEFAGFDYNFQFERLKAGAEILKKNGIETNCFMAPSHSYDNTTVKALYDLGFKTVTDGIARYPYQYEGLIFVPQTLWSPRVSMGGINTICLHSNDLTERQIKKIENFLDHSAKRVIRFSDSLADVRAYSKQYAFYWKWKHTVVDKKVLPFIVNLRKTLRS